MKISPKLGLNIPEGSDIFDYETVLKQNFEKLDASVSVNFTEVLTATAGQTVISLKNSYELGKNQLTVEVDGIPQYAGSGYTETSTTSITLAEPLQAGQKVKVSVGNMAAGDDQRISSIESSLADIASLHVKYPPIPMVAVKSDGVSDDSNALQAIIDYASTNGIPTINLGMGTIGITKTINLKAGVVLQGHTQTGYHNGLQWFDDTNANPNVPKIKAISTFAGAMFYFNYEDNKKGVAIKNALLDANKNADYGVLVYSAGLKETSVLIENCGIQGAKVDGIRLQNCLSNKVFGCTIGANGNYGINCDYGASDSIFINNYIHGNQWGGIRMSGGSFFNQVRGGKIEDNYGEGILLNGTSGSGNHVISDIQFHANNNVAIRATLGANAIVTSCQFAKNGATQTGVNSANIYVTDGNTTIQVNNCNFTSSGVTEYNIVQANNGKVIVSDSVIDSGKTAPYSGSPTLKDNIINGVSQMVNYGARMQTVTIEPSTSGSVTFANVVKTAGSYFKMGAYMLVVQSAQYPNDPFDGKTAMYLVNIGDAGGTMGIGKRPIIDILDNTWINTVTVALANTNKDITVTINTGANMGATSGHKTVYVYLMELGVNGYGII